MGRPRSDAVSRELYLARKAAVLRLYLDQGPDRSLRKLAPVVKEKFGGPSLRTILDWSRQDKWTEEAKRHDAQRAQMALRRVDEIAAEADIDEVEALRAIAAQHLRMIQSRTLSLKETRDALAIIRDALSAVADLTGGAKRPPRGTTFQATNMVVMDTRDRDQLLMDMRARMNANATDDDDDGDEPGTIDQTPVLDLDALEARAQETGENFEALLAQAPGAPRGAPEAPTPASALDKPVYVDIHELGREAAATGKSSQP